MEFPRITTVGVGGLSPYVPFIHMTKSQLSKLVAELREGSDEYDDSYTDAQIVKDVIERRVDELPNVEERQEQLRESMGVASEAAEEAVEGEESIDVVRLERKSDVAQKQEQLRKKLTR